MSSAQPLEQVIDLRSDTVTRPTKAMREAMAAAVVGDDVYGEDPTARALEERVASLLGKERALFVPTGTMANQLGIMTSTRRGDEVVCGEGAHVAWFESGAGAALSGVQFVIAGAGRGGFFTADELEDAIKPAAYYYPRTSVVALENTHNRAGGKVFPQDTVREIAARAHAKGLSVHLDGARLWNASVKTGLAVAELAAPCDTVSVCFSKGLGAPVGSAIAGTEERIKEAHRLRKMLGAGMRQVGILAAGALYALDAHMARLADDHDNARVFADELRAKLAPEHATVTAPETNIVNVQLIAAGAVEEQILALARARGLLVSAIAKRRLRAVFHLEIDRAASLKAAQILALVLADACRGT